MKVKIFTGTDPDLLEKTINNWSEDKKIISISTSAHYSWIFTIVITILYEN